jgi:WD40 repeat protein
VSSISIRICTIGCIAVCVHHAIVGPFPEVIGQTAKNAPHLERIDQLGDTLPADAIARMGTVRLRHQDTWRLSFSPNGKLLVSAGCDGAIRVWEVSTGRQAHYFGQKSPLSVVFSPDGQMLACGGWDGEIVVWDLDRNKEIVRYSGHQGSVESLAFSPTGHLLAAASEDGTARVWDVTAGTEVWRFVKQKEGVQSVTFSPDGRAMATGGRDGTIRLWELVSGKETRRFQRHSGQIQALCFSPDGKTLVSGGVGDIPTGPPEINTWDVSSGKNLTKQKQDGHWFAAALAPDGKTVALSEGRDGVELLAAPTGQKIGTLQLPPSCLVNTMAFSANSKLLATTGVGLAIQIWDLATMKPIHHIGGHQCRIDAVVFAGKDRYLATASSEGAILWDSQTGKQLGNLGGNLKYDPVLAASGDGKLLAVGSDDITLWKVATKRLVRRFPVDLLSNPSLAFSPDNRFMISPKGRGVLEKWDLTSGKQTATFPGSDDVISFLSYQIAFSQSDNSVIAAGLEAVDGHLLCCQWEMAGSKLPRVFHVRSTKRVYHVALSPDAQLLAYSDEADNIHIWQLATRKELRCFATYNNHDTGLRKIWCLAFSPDCRSLATGEGDHSIRIWEVATGQERRRFVGHRDGIRQIAFSSNGRMMASASDDTTALVWNLSSIASDKLAAADITALWTDLAEIKDAAKAYRAIWSMAWRPEQSLGLLREHLKPARSADPQVMAQLIAELESAEFAERQKDTQDLKELGEKAATDLRKVLDHNVSLETRRRVEKLLETLEAAPISGEQLRLQRAIEVLEIIGTRESRTILQSLATGASEVRVTKEAKGAIARLAMQLDD